MLGVLFKIIKKKFFPQSFNDQDPLRSTCIHPYTSTPLHTCTHLVSERVKPELNIQQIKGDFKEEEMLQRKASKSMGQCLTSNPGGMAERQGYTQKQRGL